MFAVSHSRRERIISLLIPSRARLARFPKQSKTNRGGRSPDLEQVAVRRWGRRRHAIGARQDRQPKSQDTALSRRPESLKTTDVCEEQHLDVGLRSQPCRTLTMQFRLPGLLSAHRGLRMEEWMEREAGDGESKFLSL